MKKTSIILALLLIILYPVYSQEDLRKSIFSVGAGCSLPFADFAGRTMESYAGFAGAGINMEIGFQHFSGRFFGISSSLGYASVFFKEKAYQAEYDRILGGYGQNNVSAGNYQVISGLLGFVIKTPEIRHTEALLNWQLGIAMSVHPGLVVTNSELGVINSVSKNNDLRLAGNLGLKVNYWLTERYGISLNYSLNYTRPCFHDETSIEKIFFLPVRYMNINAGFVMKLKSAH
jgi:hypothetical protein